MASTINAVNIAIRADTGLARNEIRTLHALLKSSIDPVRQLDAQMELLEKAYKDGAIEQVNYMEAKSKIIAGLKKEEEAAREAAQEYLRLKEAQEPVFMAQEVVKKADVVNSKLQSMVTYVAALGAASKTINEFISAFQRVDDFADTAASMGANYNELKTFAASLSEVGGISFDEAIKGIRTLNEQIGMASLGLGKSGKIFELLGIDPKTLASLDVTQQFDAIASAIQNLGTDAEKAAVLSKLFGNSQVAASMDGYYGKIKKVNEEMKMFNIPLTESDVDRLSKASDTFNRMSLLLTSIKDKLAAIALSDFGARMLGSFSNIFKPIEAYSLLVSSIGENEKQDKSVQKKATTLDALNKTKDEIKEAKQVQTTFENQMREINRQIGISTVGELNYKEIERRQLGFTEQQIKALRVKEEYIEAMKRQKKWIEDQKKAEEESKKIDAERNELIMKRMRVRIEGEQTIAKIISDARFRAAASMSGPAFAPLVQAETKQAFDFEVKRQQDNSKILEDQRELQRRIAAASEDTAKKIANLKPMRAAR